MKQHLKILNYIKKNIMLNLFQHLTSVGPCKNETSSRRCNSMVLFFILTIIISVFAFSDVKSFAVNTSAPVAQTLTPETARAVNEAKDTLKFAQKNNVAFNHPEEKGFSYAIYKFLMAMLGVVISAIAIFLGLKVYKKFILRNDTKHENIDYNKSLTGPRDFKEAINIFLAKTDKK